LHNDSKKEIEILLKSSYPLIYMVTWEEDRVLDLFYELSDKLKKNLYVWSVTDGFLSVNKSVASTKTPESSLEYINRSKENSVFILRDFHHYIKEPFIIRKLRDLVSFLSRTGSHIIIISPLLAIPVELEKDITVIDYKLPELRDMDKIFADTLAGFSFQGIKIKISSEEREEILKSLLGLTRREAEQVLARAAVMTGTIDGEVIDLILKEKEQIIKKSGFLEFYPSKENFGNLGGLYNLKLWLKKRSLAFTEKARAFGIPPPRGLLLTGIPGCGKSLCAKAIAYEWKKPLLHFDLGRILGGLVGESERNMRRALKIAESVAPAILWIDEIDKAFAGVSDGGDSGVTSRLLGTFLCWMEEKEEAIFIVATANNIRILPEELIRRFDEVFFLDLPSQREREEIFKIHLEKRDKDSKNFNLELLAQMTDGFSGAEIEEAIISALFDSLSEEVELNTELILKNVKLSIPLSVSMGENIDLLRQVAAHRFRLASATPGLPSLGNVNLDDIIRNFNNPGTWGN